MNIDFSIIKYIKEGVGIRGLSILLDISTTTVQKRILLISSKISPPHVIANAIYEVDEIKTFVSCKSNYIWIAYTLDRKTKSAISFSVGPRINNTLN